MVWTQDTHYSMIYKEDKLQSDVISLRNPVLIHCGLEVESLNPIHGKKHSSSPFFVCSERVLSFIFLYLCCIYVVTQLYFIIFQTTHLS